jgi:hypothetical protein
MAEKEEEEYSTRQNLNELKVELHAWLPGMTVLWLRRLCGRDTARSVFGLNCVIFVLPLLGEVSHIEGKTN